MNQARHAPFAIRGQNYKGIRRIHNLRRLRQIFIAALVLLLTAGGLTIMRKQAQATALAAEAKKKGMHYAIVVHAEAGGVGQSIALPGTLLGQIESPISSRASGYVLRWTRDIGSSVKKGELLAEISSPETEQQIKQAVAAREQAASAANLAKITLERWKGLLDQRAVSQQEYDERRSAYEQSLSNVGALEANIQRLKELLGFARILAPFDGVITRRNVNVGDLVEAGTNTSRPLFVLTQINTLRVYVYVPQAYSNNIRVGQVVSLRQAELPEQKFAAKIIRTARAIDPASRSLQVEISVQNPGGSLLPGAYVEVSLPANNRAGLVVPINTLLLRGEGPRIAVVDDKGYVRLNAVELGKDFGSKIEILSGITVTDRLVLNPGDGLSDGDHLQIIEKKDNLKDKSMKDKIKNN